MLSTEHLTFKIGSKYLLHETSAEFSSGKFHVIMGANGAGKSTLLKLLAGDQPASSGQVLLDQQPLSLFSKKELALKRAVLSQHYHISFPISVQDIVMMGRYPYFSNNPRKNDHFICREAMEMMDVLHLRDRDYTTLSGGEAQKVQMCRVLSQIWEANSQNKKILFLDEPVSHLDIKYQHQLLQVSKSLCAKHITVVAILHDINLSLSFADRIIFMKEGRIVEDMDQPELVNEGIIKKVFDINCKVIHTENQKPFVMF